MNEVLRSGKTAIALTIAGSDSGGGAGIQADIKAMSALGVYASSVITAVTAQNTRSVTDVHDIPVATVGNQIDAVLDDLEVNAIKIGMLSSVEIIELVCARMEMVDIPIVSDPVMVAKSGDRLLRKDALEALCKRLLPIATVLTPNIPEAADLLGCDEARSDEEVLEQGKRLLDLGPQYVLMKGGHRSGPVCLDMLIGRDGVLVRHESERVETRNTHGTGCTLSSSIAAGLAKSLSVVDAVGEAHAYLAAAIKASDQISVGSGHGPVHHFYRFWT